MHHSLLHSTNTLALALLIFVGIAGCASTAQLPNMAYLYSSKSTTAPLATRLHYTAADSAVLYFLPTAQYLQLTAPRKTTLAYRIYSNEPNCSYSNQPVALDLLTADTLVQRVALPLPDGCVGKANISLQAEGGGKPLQSQFAFDKSLPDSANDYLITDAKTNEILLNNYAYQGSLLQVQYRQQPNELLQVAYFKPLRQLAPPPFILKNNSNLPPRPDSSFTLQDGKLWLEKTGLYLIHRADSPANTLTGGVAFVSTEPDFPKLTTADDLREVLRYITKTEEYTALMAAKDAKKAVDNFWLQRTGSHERGKILISEFYGRVQRANRLFTSLKEGWKTDKGLIYIIYGEPNRVTFLPNGLEQWQYFSSSSMSNNLVFEFYPAKLAYSPDFQLLHRSPNFEMSWHEAVYQWRSGILP